MGAFDSLLRVNFAATPLEITAEDYSRQIQPRMGPAGEMVGEEVRVTINGYIEADDVESLYDAFGAAMNASISGIDVSIAELNLTMFEILAADCIDRGPHISFAFDGGLDGPGLSRGVRIEIAAKTIGTFLDTPPVTHPYRENESRRPDDLRQIRRTGEIHKAGAAAYFTSAVLAQFQTAYPSTAWVVSYELERSIDDKVIRYTLTARELRASLPGGSPTVDGEATIRESLDGSGRRIKVYDFDLLLDGDYTTVLAAIRPSGSIVRESFDITQHQETRLRASFEVLLGVGASELLDWKQTLKVTTAEDAYDIKTFSGVDPILVRKHTTVRVLVQSGYASGLSKFPVEPAPIAPTQLLEKPEISFERVSDYEWKTAWNYIMAIDDGAVIDKSLTGRPASPTFYP